MPSIAHELKQLAALLKEGLISREEFDQQKASLLAPKSGLGASPDVPESIGAYRILGVLGEGGMGAVYRGRHRAEAIATRQGGDVAIKVMHAHIAMQDSFRERFEREATLGLKLDHPGIVKVHDLLSDGGTLGLVMELLEGRPLSEVIGTETGPIPWARAQPLFEQILQAVGHAHGHGVVHRDIKPENVMVTKTGQLKILDFGIAKDLQAGGTKTGTGMGTVDYMAPEQYRDAKAVDHRADIYALGMTLYEMLAGRLPWAPGSTEFDVLNRKAVGELPPPTEFYPDIPDFVVAAIQAATEVEPGSRTASVEALSHALMGGAPASRRTPDSSPSVGLNPSRPASTVPISAAPSFPGPASKQGSSRAVMLGAGILLGVGLLVAVVLLVRAPDSAPVSPPVETRPAAPERLPAYAFPASGASSELIVGTGKHFEPMFDMRSSSPSGFDIDLAREVAKRIGKQRVSFRSFTSSRRIAARGEVDMAIQAISIKPEREREHLFSSAYLESSFVVIANQYRVGLRSHDLAGKVCAVWPNRVYESELRRTGCSMINFKTKGAALNAVRSGEVDFTVTDEANATVLVGDSGGRLTQPGIFLNSDRYGIVMKLGNYELKRGVDQALEDMRRDGTLRSLRGKYGI